LYIGQTTLSVEARWAQHQIRHKSNNEVIYRAMRKHGINRFYIEEIEECENVLLNEREIYWIAYYDSYKNGYNSTPGGTALPSGNAPQRLNDELVKKLWDEGLSIAEIVEQTKYGDTSVREHLIGYKNFSTDESVRRGIVKSSQTRARAISQWDETGNFVCDYRSIVEARDKTGISHQNIHSCLIGKRQTAGGFYWTYKGDLPTVGKGKPRKYKRRLTGNKICQYDKQGNLISTYGSATEAATINKLDRGSIVKVCNGERATCGGYVWKEAS
jgi:group I intron endonuclease